MLNSADPGLICKRPYIYWMEKRFEIIILQVDIDIPWFHLNVGSCTEPLS